MTGLPRTPRINHFSETTFTVEGHGVHTAFNDLAAAQTELGFRVGINEDWRNGVLHVHTVGPASLRRLVRHRGLRVASAHVTPDSLQGSLSGARFYGSSFSAYLRRFYDQAHLVIAVSATTGAELRKIGVTAPIAVVPNGVAADLFRNSATARAEARAELSPPGSFTVLGVGQIQPRKGIEAFVECAREMPGTRFVWVGDLLFGALSAGRSAMNRIVATAPPNVLFTGQLPRVEVARHCKAADVFFFPSRHETFGMAPVEAAFAGLPLVLSDLPVFDEVFATGAPAHLRARTVPEYLAHLNALRHDPDLRALAGARAAGAVARYDARHVATEIAHLYGAWTERVDGAGASVRPH